MKFSFSSSLNECPEDVWCAALMATYANEWEFDTTGTGLLLLAHRALQTQDTAVWNALSVRLINDGQEDLGNLLAGEIDIIENRLSEFMYVK